MNWAWLEQTWIIVAAVIGGITLVWNFLHKTLKEISEQLHAPIDGIETKLNSIDERVSNIDERVSDIAEKQAVTTAKVEKLSEQLSDVIDKQNLSTEALLTMQRNSLLRSCSDFLSKGYATLEQKETIAKQYKSYHDLGGDSFVTDMVNQVQELPITISYN